MTKRIMKKISWLTIIAVILGCSQCQDRESLNKIQREMAAAEQAIKKNAPVKPRVQVSDRKIIKTGEIRFQCRDLNDTRKRIDTAIEKFEGYISKENAYNYEDRIEQNIVIRVPAKNFDGLTADISNCAEKLDGKNIEARDVTEEFLDTGLRIKIKKETENRYRALLKRAKTVQEILSIEKQMGELRTEIESIEGRLKYLRDRIAYSTLTVIFYQEVSTPAGFAGKFKEGLHNGWKGFVWFLVGIVNAWPFFALLLIIYGVIIYRKKRERKKGLTEN